MTMGGFNLKDNIKQQSNKYKDVCFMVNNSNNEKGKTYLGDKAKSIKVEDSRTIHF